MSVDIARLTAEFPKPSGTAADWGLSKQQQNVRYSIAQSLGELLRRSETDPQVGKVLLGMGSWDLLIARIVRDLNDPRWPVQRDEVKAWLRRHGPDIVGRPAVPVIDVTDQKARRFRFVRG